MHNMNRSLHLLATGDASALSSGRSHIVIERKDRCRIRGLPHDLATLRVVLPNHLPVIEKLECQSALEWHPLSASKRDPFDRRALLVALAASELVGVAETARARVV